MYMPVLTYSEVQAVSRHSRELAAFGAKALIVTGAASSAQNGSLRDVQTALQKHGKAWALFDRVEQNPSVQTVQSAAAFGRREQVDFVIGVGGGSPLDAAKAIAYLLARAEEEGDTLYQPGDDRHLPLVLVPTTCGTGSEVTPISVLTRTELQTKKSIAHSIFADMSLIDGTYLRSAPLTVLRNTSLDALTHMLESYLNTRADDFSRMYVHEGLRLWRQCRPALESGRATPEEYQTMMNASAMAGMAIAQTSTTVPHGLSYSLTIQMQIPHGQAVGYFTAGYLAKAGERRCRELLDGMGFAEVEDFQRWYCRYYGRLQPSEALLHHAAEELWSNQQKLRTVPFDLTRQDVEDIALYSLRFAE